MDTTGYLPVSVDSVGGDTIILFKPSVTSSTEVVRDAVDCEIPGYEISWIGVNEQSEPPDGSRKNRNIRIHVYCTLQIIRGGNLL